MQCTTQAAGSYRLMTPDERGEIMIGLRNGESMRSIARRLGRQPSVVVREIRANSTEDGRYQSYWAQKRSERRRRMSRQRERIADHQIRHYLHEKLKEGWSPGQIAGRIGMELPGNGSATKRSTSTCSKRNGSSRNISNVDERTAENGSTNAPNAFSFPIASVLKTVRSASTLARNTGTGKATPRSADRARRR